MIVSWVAIAACVVLFLLINRSMSPIDKAVELGALLPLRVKRGEYWRLLAAGFLRCLSVPGYHCLRKYWI